MGIASFLQKPVNGDERGRLGAPKQLMLIANREGSNRATFVALQEPTESFATLDLAAVVVRDHSAVDEFVSQPLMRALEMVVVCEYSIASEASRNGAQERN